MELATIGSFVNKGRHLLLQEIDVLEWSIECAKDRDLFSHRLAPGNVLHPQGVQDNVWNLHRLSVGDALEDGVEQGNVLNSQLLRRNVNAITDIVGVLNEEEDAGTQDLLSRGRKDERKGKKRSSRCSQGRAETRGEESDYFALEPFVLMPIWESY